MVSRTWISALLAVLSTSAVLAVILASSGSAVLTADQAVAKTELGTHMRERRGVSVLASISSQAATSKVSTPNKKHVKRDVKVADSSATPAAVSSPPAIPFQRCSTPQRRSRAFASNAMLDLQAEPVAWPRRRRRRPIASGDCRVRLAKRQKARQ